MGISYIRYETLGTPRQGPLLSIGGWPAPGDRGWLLMVGWTLTQRSAGNHHAPEDTNADQLDWLRGPPHVHVDGLDKQDLVF